MRIIHKAKKGDYPEYAEMYMKWLPDDGKILEQLWTNFLEAKKFISLLPDSVLDHRYQPGKWNIREMLVHIMDDERIFSYRAMSFARREVNSLTGFDQDSYVLFSGAGDRSVESIFEEYEAIRRSTIALFKYLPEEALDQMGKGSGSFHGATPRAMLYHIAGHEQHHMHFIKDHYL